MILLDYSGEVWDCFVVIDAVLLMSCWDCANFII